MAAQQKHAWFNLAVLTVTLGLYAVLAPLLGPHRGLGAFGLCGLWGLGALFYRNPRSRPAVVMDERDQTIQQRSVVMAYSMFWLCFVAACMGTWAVVRYGQGQGSISVDVLPLFVWGGFVLFTLVQSVAVLVQYGREKSHGG